MKRKFLFSAAFILALFGASLMYSSCGKDDSNPDNTVVGTLVSSLECTVKDFAVKYITLKKGEKVFVTLTDVSDANLAQVSETLRKMSVTRISKSGSDQFRVILVLKSQESLTKIPAKAFKGCTAISEITIPESVRKIEAGAFADCTELSEIEILGADTDVEESFPEYVAVKRIRKRASLKPSEIVDFVAASTDEIVTLDMALETYDHTEVMKSLSKIEDKKVKLVIPEGVKVLAIDTAKLQVRYVIEGQNYYDFPQNTSLVEVSIPKGAEIGLSAFYHCRSLTSITIPEGVTKIGGSAFSGCGLSSVTIPEGVTEIGSYAFFSCESLTNVAILGKGVEIKDYAFWGCSNLVSVSISGSVSEIGDFAFKDCKNLTNVSPLKGVKKIGYRAFCLCSSLSSITIPDGATEIAYNAFEFTKINKLNVPTSVKNWGSYYFKDGNLRIINIPEGITEIKERAFDWCPYLTNVTIPDGVTKIGEYAFSRCGLVSINIPEGVTSIGDGAFSGCGQLTSLSLPKSLISIGRGVFSNYSIEGPEEVYHDLVIYCSRAIYDRYHDEYPMMRVYSNSGESGGGAFANAGDGTGKPHGEALPEGVDPTYHWSPGDTGGNGDERNGEGTPQAPVSPSGSNTSTIIIGD